MKAYQTDILGYYIGEVDCQKNPLIENEYAIPAGATIIKPPNKQLHKISKFNGSDWILEPNYSDIKYYSKKDKMEKQYNKGEQPDFELYTDIKPTFYFPYIIFDNIKNEWIEDPKIKSEYKKIECELKAKELISKSDWSVLPDVKLINKIEFENYRSILRNLILNPIEDPIFPVEPNPIWSK
jgi:hypothetical protein